MKLLGVLLSLGVVVILARILGPTEYGIYSYVMAIVSLLAVPVQFGLPTLVIRETARAHQKQQWAALKGLWRWSARLAGVFSLLIALAILGGALLFSNYLTEYQETALLWGLLLVPLVVWGNLRGAALIGLQRVALGQFPENILRPGFLLVLLLGIYFGRTDFALSAVEAIILTVIAATLSLFIIAAILRANRPVQSVNVPPVYQQRVWFSAIWPLALVAGIQVVNRYTDILMLGLFASADQVGIYRVATQSAELVAFVLVIVNTVVAPHFARLHAEGEIEQLEWIASRGAQVSLLGALPIVLVILLAGDVVLRLMFGSAYQLGHTALAILSVGQLFNVAMGSAGLLLNMTGHERETAKGAAIAALLNVPLNLALIPLLGMNGAALATATSLLVWTFMLWQAVRRHIGLDSTALRIGDRAK